MKQTGVDPSNMAVATRTGNASERKSQKRKNPFTIQLMKEEKERRQKKRARLVVRNISFKATEESLRDHFKQFGEIEDINLLKRPDDGKLVGCAFVQYATVNQATKAIFKGNNQPFLGRSLFVDWALAKDEYLAKKSEVKEEPKLELNAEEKQNKKPKIADETVCNRRNPTDAMVDCVKTNSSDENEYLAKKSEVKEKQNKKPKIGDETVSHPRNHTDVMSDCEKTESSDEDESCDSEYEDEDHKSSGIDSEDNDYDSDVKEDQSDFKADIDTISAKKQKHISNDVNEGCTVFIKNVPFDATDYELRKVCRKFGPVYYAIINRDPVSDHSKSTAFVKYKSKESADLCLQSGTEFSLMDQVLDPHPALSREEIRTQTLEKSKKGENKDSRNLYLAREGLIMSGATASIGVSASDMAKRHELERIKTQVLKNLNRFVSRNRLSIHNLPLSYDNEKLKQMIISYTGLKPHECRVMREFKITPEHPKGKSKGFGFMSFDTHQHALTALRRLNNNPKIFSNNHRPIVAFSIEDRSVHKIKETRKEKSKLSNPTYQRKLQIQRDKRKDESKAESLVKHRKRSQQDDKANLKKQIKKLEDKRADDKACTNTKKNKEELQPFVGTASKPGIRMRSLKKIREQSLEHLKRVKANKRKEKQKKIRKAHLSERKAIVRPKQGRKIERDDLSKLVSKYKRLIDSGNAVASKSQATGAGPRKQKVTKRTKWYKD